MAPFVRQLGGIPGCSTARLQERPPPVCLLVQVGSKRCRPFSSRERSSCHSFSSAKAVQTAVEVETVNNDAKRDLLAALSSVQDNGVYGLENAQREKLMKRIEDLEACNPLEAPTEHLDQCHGSWRLLFSTVTILGRRRIKLGLRNVVNVGELTQHIHTTTCHTVNVVNFDILVFGKFKGSLTIEASFEPVSPNRVAIKLEKATLVPEQFQQLFQKNYELLMDIFNPQGWLDITFVDSELRIGRDDKGNVFVLERM